MANEQNGWMMPVAAGLLVTLIAGYFMMPTREAAVAARTPKKDGVAAVQQDAPRPTQDGRPSAPPSPAAPDPATLRNRARGLTDQGLPTNGAAPGGAPVGDVAAIISTAADGAMKRLGDATAKSRDANGWSPEIQKEVDGVLERVDKAVAEIEDRVAAGELGVNDGIKQIEAAVINGAGSAAKVAGAPGSINPSPPVDEEAERKLMEEWGGIPFEEWAAQVEAEQKPAPPSPKK